MSNDRLIIFVKAPIPGLVKSRLAQTLGPEQACEVYRTLVEIVLGNVRNLSNVELRHTPDNGLGLIKPWVANGWSTRGQGEGDLGERMHRAFCDVFVAGVRKAVIIGSDCPELAASDVESAWAALGDHDLVLGPATDGGYSLIGLKQPQPQIFEGITWSSNRVLEQTLARAATQNLRVHLLRELSDVDTEEDWLRFQGLSVTGKSRSRPRR